MEKLKHKPTQCDKILEVLEKAGENWTNGRYFIQTMMISQAHTRIWELIHSKKIDIETSEFSDEYGFRSYRIKQKTCVIVEKSVELGDGKNKSTRETLPLFNSSKRSKND